MTGMDRSPKDPRRHNEWNARMAISIQNPHQYKDLQQQKTLAMRLTASTSTHLILTPRRR